MSQNQKEFSYHMNNNMVAFNINNCMARKNKKDGILLQCPFKKKNGSFCGKHSLEFKKNKFCLRIDEKLDPKLIQKKKKKKSPIVISLSEYINNNLKDYSCESLKKTLHHYKLSRQGNKNLLLERLSHHFDSLQEYEPSIPKINFLQMKIKSYLKNRDSKLRGPGFYNRNSCNNTEDFYSFELLKDIKNERFFSYRDTDNFIYGFDIKSFHKLIELKQSNPYNRKKIPCQAIQNMKKILEINKNKNLLEEDKPVILTSQQKFDQKLLSIFQQIELLTSSVNVNWFINLSISDLKKYYKCLEDIWNYRAELNLTQKIRIVKDKTMFPITVHNFYKINNLNKLRSIILHEIEKLIFTADEDSDKTLACYYVLTAFCEVSANVRNVFPWLVQM